jgi:hypothetical protein
MEYVLIWIIGSVVGLAITYAVIQAAVRSALFGHYKVVRWYEATGEWLPSYGWLRPREWCGFPLLSVASST